MRLPAILGWSLALAISPIDSLAQPPVTAIAFTPDGDQVLVGAESTLEIRDWPSLEKTAKKSATLDTELPQIHDIEFSPDGKRLLIAGGSPSEYGEWKVLSWPDRKLIADSVEHDDVIYSAAWQANNRFATGAADSLVIGWQLGTAGATETMRLTAHSRRVLSVAFLAHGKLLVTAGVDQSLRVWRGLETATVADQGIDSDLLRPPRPLRLLDNHTGIVRDLAVRPGEHAIPYIGSASADKTVRIWQPTIGRLVRFVRLPVEPLSIAWSVDGRSLAVGCVDGKLRVVDPSTVKVVAELEAIDGWAYEVVAAADGSFVVGGSGGQIVRLVPATALP